MVFDISVQGMHCETCCTKVKKALKATSGVRHVDVRLDAGLARVVGDVPRDLLEKAIRAAGFTVAGN